LTSKLFSGGIENRFIYCFEEKSRKSFEDLAVILGDETLLKYVTKQDPHDTDAVLKAIIHKDKNKNIDLLLDVLQKY
jgi:hypothetical protein